MVHPTSLLLAAMAVAATAAAAAPIISGTAPYRYQYMPHLLQIPAHLSPKNDHGLTLDHNDNIILTYEPNANDSHCMIKWNPDGTGGAGFGPGAELCAGTPHGLRLSHEGPSQTPYLYHANNNQVLHKTDMEGNIIWTVEGPPNNNSKFLPYKPTWFSTPPGSPYVFMADGYGSSLVHVFTTEGKYTGNTFGGKGTADGQFMTCHSINYDPRTNQLVVSDRENHRHQWFNFNPTSPSLFEFSHKSTTLTSGNASRPCNMRFKYGNGMSIVPDLVGPVGILNEKNELISTVQVGELLGDQGHKFPHDALFLKNGDIVVATWNPGRISYWKKLD